MSRMLHQLTVKASVRATFVVVGALVALISSTQVAATALSGASTSALWRGEVVRCVPALPVFCANVHVACAGRSRVPTFSFDVRPGDGVASLEPVDSPATAGTSQRRGEARRGALRFDPANGSAIVALDPAPAYLRVTREGRFSLRQYVRGAALMAYGRCTPRG